MTSDDHPENLRCRFCLGAEVNELIPVFCIASTQNLFIAHMALACTGLVISCRDKLPQYSCDECLGKLDLAYACWKRCRQSWGNYISESALSLEGEDYRCRICLESEVEELISLFCICDNQSITISEVLKRFAGLSVTEKDEFPQYICDVCLGQLNAGFSFRKLAWRSFESLQDEEKNPIGNPYDSPVEILSNSSYLDESEISILIDKTTDNEDPLKIEELIVPQKQTNTIQPISSPLEIRKPKQNGISDSETAAVQPKIARFSTPEEFKRLASQILNKSGNKTNPIKTTTETSPTRTLSNYLAKALANRPKVGQPTPATTSLVPNRYVVTRSMDGTALESDQVSYSGISWARIKTFNCKNCNCGYLVSEITDKCTVCTLPFDNYPSTQLQKLAKEQGYLDGYCCQKCNFFTNRSQALTPHLKMHDKAAVRSLGNPEKITSNGLSSCAQRIQKNQHISTDAQKKSQAPSATVTASDTPSGVVPSTPPVEPFLNTKKISLVKRPVTSGNQLITTLQPPAKKQHKGVSQNREANVEPTISISDSENEMESIAQPSMDVDHTELDTILTIEPIKIQPDLESAKSEIGICFEVSSDEEFSGFVDEDLKRDQHPASTLSTTDTRHFDVLQQTSEFITLFFKGVLCCGCLEMFGTPKQLQIHRERFHSTVQRRTTPDMCGNCNTADSSSLDHRMLNSKRIFYYCKLCSALLIDEIDFESHRSSEHTAERQRLISTPNELLVCKRGIESLLRTIENPTHCFLPFKSIDNGAIFHAVKETGDYKLLFMRGHLCCGCQHWYSTYDALKAHCDETHRRCGAADSFTCDLCHMDCKSPSRLTRHQLQQSRRLHYYCKLCHEFLLHHADDYRAHRAIAHNVQINADMPSNDSETMEMLISKAV